MTSVTYEATLYKMMPAIRVTGLSGSPGVARVVNSTVRATGKVKVIAYDDSQATILVLAPHTEPAQVRQIVHQALVMCDRNGTA